MSLLQNVLAWSEKELPLWLQDSARRLFFSNDLTPQDYRELYALLKAGKGIKVEPEVKAVPLSADHIPAEIAQDSCVVLQSMLNLKNVNRIAENQTLSFSASGITVIYGGNGAGKSGYARVLKHACRAREKGGEVLVDATRQLPPGTVPTAEFSVLVDGEAKILAWESGAVSPPELSTISVFDTGCAGAYLVEGEAAYLPRGLDIVEGLANKVVPEVSALLNAEIAGLDTRQDILAGFVPGTEVGNLISSFSSKISVDEVRRLGAVSEADIQRVAELELALAEGNPLEKAAQLKLSAGHIKALAGRIKEQDKFIGERTVDRLRELVEEHLNGQRLVEEAAEALRSSDSLLPGTGETVWRELFFAAKRYADEVAYVGHEFPCDQDGMVCVLCQQPLVEGKERLERFNKFISDDVAKLAAEKAAALDRAIGILEKAALDFGLDKAITEELGSGNAELIERIVSFQDYVRSFRDWMIECARSGKWSNPPEKVPSPVPAVRAIAAQKLWMCRTYTKAADAERSAKLKAELAEFKDRRRLEPLVDSIIELARRMSLKEVLEGCKAELNPRALSAKSKDIAGRIITGSLKQALDSEFKRLGVGHIKTKLKERVERGKVKFTLVLDLPVAKKIDNILSEGEQRAVALAAFLAELKLSNHKCGIIFDDPVSSLDHVRRRKVAMRLIAEAKERQVIVLTHDIAFLSELVDGLADVEEVKREICHLEWVGDFAGVVKPGLPWDKTGYKERIRVLQQRIGSIPPWVQYPSDEQVLLVRGIYSDIRATIEKVVEDIVLNGVVTRFSDVVGVGNLHKITGLRKEDAQGLIDLWKKCHRITGAHHQAQLKDVPVPDVDEMNADVSLVQELTANVIKYRDQPKA